MAAADDVRLALPETGVCSTRFDEAASGCCTTDAAEPIAVTTGSRGRETEKTQGVPATACCAGPPLQRADARCVAHETAKDTGRSGCGCGLKPAAPGRGWLPRRPSS